MKHYLFLTFQFLGKFLKTIWLIMLFIFYTAYRMFSKMIKNEML